jgi:hypothetical protein
MTETSLLWVLGGTQTITWLLLGWIKLDIKSLWRRADSHGHVIECTHAECRAKTDAVVLHESGGRG